jgi:transposase-like protein
MKRKLSATRQDYWNKLIDEQVGSGKSVSAFCHERGVCDASFYTWRKRLNSEAPLKFALVEPSQATSRTSGVELALATGERLHIARGADASTLRMVHTILRER